MKVGSLAWMLGAALAALLISTPSAPARGVARSLDCTMATYPSTDVPKAIPDPGAAESALVVPAGDPVAGARVRVTVTHPFDSDLELELISPEGKSVLLAKAVGTWGHDFAGTVFDDAAATSVVSSLPPFARPLRPVEPLSDMIGSQRAGTWKLRATDLRGRYAGRIDGWKLELASCGTVSPPPSQVGAPDPPPLPNGVPTGHVPVEGTLIVVTTTSDQPKVEGDGISLREAIETTNDNPGTYTIRFDPSLAGQMIEVGSAGAGSLPALEGGGVLIDGDIDGDGRPDVTIVNRQSDPYGPGLYVVSGDNRLHALAVQGFRFGVVLATLFKTPFPSRLTYARNVVSGLVVTGAVEGIRLAPTEYRGSCFPTACETGNRWADTRFVRNTIEVDRAGIEAELYGTSKETVERTTIAGNTIHVDTRGKDNGFGVNLSAGGGAGANEDRISDALVAYNSIDAQGALYAVNLFSGLHGGSANVVEDVGIVGNHVRISDAKPVPDSTKGVAIATSDGCSGSGPGEGVCSHDNTARRIDILGNSLVGAARAGVMATDSCCGGSTNSTIDDLVIARNRIEGILPPYDPSPWGIEIGAGNTDVSHVTIASNTVEQRATAPSDELPAYLSGGGIALVGGLGAGSEIAVSVEDVAVTSNRVDTDLAGIVVIGGGPSAFEAAHDTSGHNVSRVRLRSNTIVRTPVLATRWDPRAKGINVIGGLGGTPPATGQWWTTTGNSVTLVTLENNLVVGVVDDVSLRSNFGEGASGNVAAFGARRPILSVSVSGRGSGAVTSDPAGIACQPTCSHEFDDRTEVTLTAGAASDSRFHGWSGDCVGSVTCALSMDRDHSVTARFDSVCLVPNVRAKPLAAAKVAIREANCSIGSVKRVFSVTVKKGRVISQNPRPGACLGENARVDLVVSRGRRR